MSEQAELAYGEIMDLALHLGGNDHRRTRRRAVEAALAGRLSRARRHGAESSHQRRIGPAGHPEPRRGRLTRDPMPQ